MKKSNLAAGVVYFLVGAALLLTAVLTDTKLDGLLYGFGGACLGPGIAMIYKYFYWTKPENKERYEERLENEKIEMNDELKIKLRDKAGRYAYIFGIYVICISIVVFSILGQLGIIENSLIIVLYLCGYLVLQYAMGIVFFNRLMKKY